MATFFSKASTFLASLAHRNLDRQIKKNAPEYLKQLIRDVEEAVDEAAAATAGAKGELNAARAEAGDIQRQSDRLKSQAKRLLTDPDPSNDHFADDLMTQKIEKDKALTAQNELIAVGETTLVSVEKAWQMLKQRKEQLITQLQELTTLDRATKAKEAGAAAIQAANEAMGGIDGRSVDDFAGDMRRRAAVADAKLDQQTSSMTDGAAEAVRDSEAAAAVAELRAEIEASKGNGTPAPGAGVTPPAPVAAKSTETV